MIFRQRDRLAGIGYAVAGIVIGGVFTMLTVAAFFLGEAFGFDGILRERNMTQSVNTTGPLEVVARGWSITRPTQQWGVARDTQEVNDPLADLFLAKATPGVGLVQIKHNGFVDVREETDAGKRLDTFLSDYLSDYQSGEDFGGPQGKEEGFMRISHGRITRQPTQTTAPPGCT